MSISTRKFKVVKSLCRQCGIADKGSKLDCILRLREKINTRSGYDKVFSKIWGASGTVSTLFNLLHKMKSIYNGICMYVYVGGWLSASCPHKVVYALKFVLRAEGPRDYVDILMSMKYQPNVTIVDMAHMVAAHGCKRKSNMFHPYCGRLVESTKENIQSAEEGRLTVNLPWLIDSFREPLLPTTNTTTELDHSYDARPHPITG